MIGTDKEQADGTRWMLMMICAGIAIVAFLMTVDSTLTHSDSEHIKAQNLAELRGAQAQLGYE